MGHGPIRLHKSRDARAARAEICLYLPKKPSWADYAEAAACQSRKRSHMKIQTPSGRNFAVRSILLAASTWWVSLQGAVVTPAAFTPPNPIGGAPIGWAYAGNKFIGSILDNGTGQNL